MHLQNIFALKILDQQHYTLIIIGGGRIGIASALAAKEKGIDYVILEKAPW
ncbi:MAG: hypothetical protein ACR2KB_13915 [Chitinophagaceae bacterium]